MTHSREARTTALLQNHSVKRQFSIDTAMWFGTLTYGTPWKVRLLRKLFAVFHHGMLMFRSRGMWHAFKDQSVIPLAAVLSHGGRVLIQLPANDGNSFWDWLWGGQRPESRMAATHGVFFGGAAQALPYGFTKGIVEVGKGGEGRHYGINIGCGGVGNINPFSGVPIVEDGEHGHVYLCYVAPTSTRVGAILVGVEDSAPIDRARVFSQGHRTHFFAQGQTGHKHKFGAAGTYSCTGGEKWQGIERRQSQALVGGGPAPTGPWYTKDSFFVDLSGGYTDPMTRGFYDLGLLGGYGAGPAHTPTAVNTATVGVLPPPEIWDIYSKDLARDIKRDTGGMSHYKSLYDNIRLCLVNYASAIAANRATDAANAKLLIVGHCDGFIQDRATHNYPESHFLLIEDLKVRAT